jgi:uncharacterized protein (TIGR02145 family)
MHKFIFCFIIIQFFNFNLLDAQTITIGKQNWMSKNLEVTKFRNGESIQEAKTEKEWYAAIENKQPAWCYYNYNSSNGLIYGKLYNIYAINDSRGLAPAGFHIPSDEEWQELVNFAGGTPVAGKKLRSKDHWQVGNEKCSNCSNWSDDYRLKVPCHICKDKRLVPFKNLNNLGFSAVPGGYKHSEYSFWYLNQQATFYINYNVNDWFKSIGIEPKKGLTDTYPCLGIDYQSSQIIYFNNGFNGGVYVRCIKDSEDWIQKEKIKKEEKKQLQVNFQLILPKIDSLLNLYNFADARLLAKNEKLEYDNKVIINKKIDSSFITYLDFLIAKNEFKKFDKFISLEENSNNLEKTYQAMLPNLKAKRNYQENVFNYEILIAPIKNKSLTVDEKILIGDWDFKSKNLNMRSGDGDKSYFVDVIRFNADRTFYLQIKEFFTIGNGSDWMQEKTGYWKYENNQLTLYIDYETTNKNKVRVNKIQTIVFTELSETEIKKTFEIGSWKFEMKGKKRL